MLRHAQIQIVASQTSQKTADTFFTDANGSQKIFSIKMFFFQEMGASALRLRGPSGHVVEKNICVPFAFVKKWDWRFLKHLAVLTL